MGQGSSDQAYGDATGDATGEGAAPIVPAEACGTSKAVTNASESMATTNGRELY